MFVCVCMCVCVCAGVCVCMVVASDLADPTLIGPLLSLRVGAGFHTGFSVWGGGRCCVWVNWDGGVYFLLALPVGTATVERSFSHMKMIKTRLRNRLSDENLTHLMRIAIEGPDLSEVNFNEILDIKKK